MHDADDLLAAISAVAVAERPQRHASCVEWLAAELAASGRPIPVAALRARAALAGWSWSAVRKARGQLRLVTVRRRVEAWRRPLASEL